MRRAVSEADKEQRRRQLLTAARRVFAERGFEATTMADVSRAAGLSYGVAYWYFESKEALFLALLEAEEEALRARLAGALDAPEVVDLASGLAAAVTALFVAFDEDRHAARLLFRDRHTLGDEYARRLTAVNRRFVGELEWMLAEGQLRGEVRSGPPRLLALAAAALVGQVVLRRLSDDDGLGAEDAAALTVSLLLDGMGPREEAPTSDVDSGNCHG